MVKNSVGNVIEILQLLDKDNYSGVQLEQNYQALIERWGEWEIVNAGSAGLVVRYVDIGHALFSGLMITYGTFTLVCFCLALILGKLTFPLLAKHFVSSNEEIVDMATLKSAAQIDQISKKEWF